MKGLMSIHNIKLILCVILLVYLVLLFHVIREDYKIKYLQNNFNSNNTFGSCQYIFIGIFCTG